MLGLTSDLACFPSFHVRLGIFNPGLERVLQGVHRKLHSEDRTNVYDIHAPLVPVVAQLMLHILDEWEVFALLSHLLARTAWLDHSRGKCAASQFTLLSLLHSHAVSLVVLVV